VGKTLPPRYVWAPTLRKTDLSPRRRRCRVWCRVPTASSPMGCSRQRGAAGAGQLRLEWRYFSPALTDVVIERDEDGYYVAWVPQLPGCHTQGRSLDEVTQRIREAIELCLGPSGCPGECC
jgi:hypothetical protein